jgi:hypothetical protein
MARVFAENRFLSPGSNGAKAGDYSTALNLVYGQPQLLRWTTDAAAVDLLLWQEKTNIMPNGVSWGLPCKRW